MKSVYLNDTNIDYDDAEEHFAQAAAWASRQCSSYIDYHVQNVSDSSLINDFIAQYQFGNPKDALLFELRWKTA